MKELIENVASFQMMPSLVSYAILLCCLGIGSGFLFSPLDSKHAN